MLMVTLISLNNSNCIKWAKYNVFKKYCLPCCYFFLNIGVFAFMYITNACICICFGCVLIFFEIYLSCSSLLH